MLNLRQQTVNVDRHELIKAISAGLVKHEQELLEARTEYRTAVTLFLTEALNRTTKGDFNDVHLKLQPPVSKRQQYTDVIEMLRVSVDSTIQLDSEAYRAYYKNEWPWTASFNESVGAIKQFLSAKAG